MFQKKRNVVYSTDGPIRCPRCGHAPCRCPKLKTKSLPPAEQTAHLHREKSGRGGKWVIVVRNLQLSPEDMKELSRHLKQKCGTGGTVKDGAIEIQGDQREAVAAALQQLGYKTKQIGG